VATDTEKKEALNEEKGGPVAVQDTGGGPAEGGAVGINTGGEEGGGPVAVQDTGGVPSEAGAVRGEGVGVNTGGEGVPTWLQDTGGVPAEGGAVGVGDNTGGEGVSTLRAAASCVRVLACGHQFHLGCISSWREQSYECPLCKA